MNRKKLLTIVLGVVVLAALPNLVPIPSRVTMNNEAAAARGEAETLNKQISASKRAAADAEAFKAYNSAMSKAVPAGPDLPGLITELRSAAEQSGLDWEAGSPQAIPAVDASGPSTWTLSVTLRGPDGGLPSMLDGVRRMDRLVVVDSVSYQTASSGDVTATLMLRFFATGPKDPAPVASPTSVPPTAPTSAATSATADSTTEQALPVAPDVAPVVQPKKQS